MQFLRVIRGVTAIVAPCEVCTAVVHKPRRQCCDFLVTCFLTGTFYFFVYLFCVPLIDQCEFDSSVHMED